MMSLASAALWHVGTRRFVLARPLIMGILNVTPDSFSDGGRHDDAASAVAFAQSLVAAGADIVDVGGESTRPGAHEVADAEELARVLPVVSALAKLGICVSIDTRHPRVAAACVKAGAQIINDISGFEDRGMIEVAAGCDAGVVAMHMAGTPQNMQQHPVYDDAVGQIADYLLGRARALEQAGVAADRICLDPGPGFGKNLRHNLEILAGMQHLAQLGFPLMAAFSRKGALGAITGVGQADKRVVSSAAAAALAYCGGARVFRVHDVAQTVEALQVFANAAYVQQSPDGNLATMLPGKRALVALGSNMPADAGSPVANLVQATRLLDALPGTRVMASSSIYRTEPAYYEDQDTFANSVAWVQTELAPNQLLEALFSIEDDFHRVRVFANGPRTLDLDVLDYQGVVSHDPHLILPHPRVLERDFTVTPLLELADAMLASLGRYAHPDAIGQLGRPDGRQGGFRLADGTRVTRDGVRYGRIIETLLPASQVI